MADVLHSSLTGADLHECKGAASASLGTVPVATGLGTAVFANLNWSYINGKPSIPTTYYAGSSVSAPIVQNFITTSTSGGVWTVPMTGFSNIHHVQATAINAGGTLGTAAIATVTSASSSSVSGLSLVFSGSGGLPVATVGITIHLQVWGV